MQQQQKMLTQDKTKFTKHKYIQHNNSLINCFVFVSVIVSNPKQPSSKKGAAPKKAMVKKDVKSKVAAKKWL